MRSGTVDKVGGTNGKQQLKYSNWKGGASTRWSLHRNFLQVVVGRCLVLQKSCPALEIEVIRTFWVALLSVLILF